MTIFLRATASPYQYVTGDNRSKSICSNRRKDTGFCGSAYSGMAQPIYKPPWRCLVLIAIWRLHGISSVNVPYWRCECIRELFGEVILQSNHFNGRTEPPPFCLVGSGIGHICSPDEAAINRHLHFGLRIREHTGAWLAHLRHQFRNLVPHALQFYFYRAAFCRGDLGTVNITQKALLHLRFHLASSQGIFL